MKNFKQKWFNIFLIVCFSFALLGCSTNFYGAFVDANSDPVTLLQNASTAEDYQKVIEIADEIINNPNSTPEEIKNALAIKGEAILALNNLSTLDRFANITTLS